MCRCREVNTRVLNRIEWAPRQCNGRLCWCLRKICAEVVDQLALRQARIDLCDVRHTHGRLALTFLDGFRHRSLERLEPFHRPCQHLLVWRPPHRVFGKNGPHELAVLFLFLVGPLPLQTAGASINRWLVGGHRGEGALIREISNLDSMTCEHGSLMLLSQQEVAGLVRDSPRPFIRCTRTCLLARGGGSLRIAPIAQEKCATHSPRPSQLTC